MTNSVVLDINHIELALRFIYPYRHPCPSDDRPAPHGVHAQLSLAGQLNERLIGESGDAIDKLRDMFGCLAGTPKLDRSPQ